MSWLRGWLRRLVYPVVFIFGWPAILLAATGLGIIAVPALLWPPYLVIGWFMMLAVPMTVLSPTIAAVSYGFLVGGFLTSTWAALTPGGPERTRPGMAFIAVTFLYYLWVLAVLYVVPLP